MPGPDSEIGLSRRYADTRSRLLRNDTELLVRGVYLEDFGSETLFALLNPAISTLEHPFVEDDSRIECPEDLVTHGDHPLQAWRESEFRRSKGDDFSVKVALCRAAVLRALGAHPEGDVLVIAGHSRWYPVNDERLKSEHYGRAYIHVTWEDSGIEKPLKAAAAGVSAGPPDIRLDRHEFEYRGRQR